jgi:hypothetical protein
MLFARHFLKTVLLVDLYIFLCSSAERKRELQRGITPNGGGKAVSVGRVGLGQKSESGKLKVDTS